MENQQRRTISASENEGPSAHGGFSVGRSGETFNEGLHPSTRVKNNSSAVTRGIGHLNKGPWESPDPSKKHHSLTETNLTLTYRNKKILTVKEAREAAQVVIRAEKLPISTVDRIKEEDKEKKKEKSEGKKECKRKEKNKSLLGLAIAIHNAEMRYEKKEQVRIKSKLISCNGLVQIISDITDSYSRKSLKKK